MTRKSTNNSVAAANLIMVRTIVGFNKLGITGYTITLGWYDGTPHVIALVNSAVSVKKVKKNPPQKGSYPSGYCKCAYFIDSGGNLAEKIPSKKIKLANTGFWIW